MSEGKIKVAVIGAGYMAQEHIRAFADIAEVEISGIFSRTRSRAEALATMFSIPHVCDSVKELYAVTKADLVIISVNELAARDTCFEAFAYPWASLIEKPVGYDFEEAALIAAEADQRKARAFVALNRRHYASTRGLINELASTTQQRLIHVSDQENPFADGTQTGRPELVVKNWMYANSIHLVDYFSLLGRGAITSVEPIVKWDPAHPQFVVAKITYDSGDIGIYEAVWNAPGPWAISVTTHDNRWELKPVEKLFVQKYGTRKLEPLAENEWDTQFKPGIRQQAQEAIHMLTGKPHTLPSLREALASMQIVKNIYSI